MTNFPPYALTLVTKSLEDQDLKSYLEFLVDCSKHGVTSIQIRHKGTFDHQIKTFVCDLQEALKPYATKLVMNDYDDLMQELGLDSVHVGQQDIPVEFIRQKFGGSVNIGLSIDHISQISKANTLDIDYIGVGAIFKSKSKQTATIWGLEGLAEAVKQSNVPVVAIGGLNSENAKHVLAQGVKGLAFIEHLHPQPQQKVTPQEKIQYLITLLKEHYAN